MASYNRYSHHARRALTHASLLVQRFQHPRVDTGHLLVGVLLTEGSIGCVVLMELNLQVEQAMNQLAALTMPLGKPLDAPANDAALDIALELAEDESSWLGHHYVGTEHLLLGITRTNVGNASDLLRLLNVPAEHVRRRVRRALSDGLSEFTLQLARRSARLSELSRRVLNAAEQLSISYDHPTIGLGHLLLVLARERRSSTGELLVESGLSVAGLEAQTQQRDALALLSLEAVLDQAVEQAQSLGSHYTGTEHLLLALLLDSAGAALLRQNGVDVAVLSGRVDVLLNFRR